MMSFLTRKHRTHRAALTTIAASLTLALGLAEPVFAADAPAPVWRTDATASVTESHDLIRLVPGGLATAVKLTGAMPTQYFDFGVRADEIVSKATLDLSFTPSPSLIPGTSQLNVYLNGELQGVTAITKEMLGKPTSLSVALNAKSMKTRNQLSVEFVGHYSIVCENEGNSALWLDISPTSQLTLEKQNLRLTNDLAQLPLPFVDTSVEKETTLPVVFASAPSKDALRAAAIVTGRVAAASAWRGADFPVYFSEVPAQGHFVVFATNENRPAFLRELAPFEGPELLMLDAPGGLYEKMLVVAGKTDADLVTAAQAFATTGRILIGPRAAIKDFKAADPLPAYVSPNWVNTDFAVPLSQLIEYPEQLTARGETLPPLHVAFRLAPDTYLTSASSATLNLLYRYTKPVTGQAAQLRTLVNGALADSQNLSDEESRGAAVVNLPVPEGPAVTAGALHKGGLGFVNDLSFEAGYQQNPNEGTPENCRAATLTSHQVQIDPSSMIEFSGMYHYAQLPEIGLFTQGAFPFSMYADLSRTAAVVRKENERHAVDHQHGGDDGRGAPAPHRGESRRFGLSQREGSAHRRPHARRRDGHQSGIGRRFGRRRLEVVCEARRKDGRRCRTRTPRHGFCRDRLREVPRRQRPHGRGASRRRRRERPSSQPPPRESGRPGACEGRHRLRG